MKTQALSDDTLAVVMRYFCELSVNYLLGSTSSDFPFGAQRFRGDDDAPLECDGAEGHDGQQAEETHEHAVKLTTC